MRTTGDARERQRAQVQRPAASGGAARRASAMFAVLALAFAASVPAWAQAPGSQLGGYDARASALAISFQPVFPALIPTGDAPFEGTLALSSGNVRSGGLASARGAVVWPGSALADLGPLIGAGAGQEEVGGLIPQWPLQAQATQDDGEVVTGAPPALVMRAVGAADVGFGEVRIADVLVGGIVHVEHVASTAETVARADGISSVARVALHGVSLLDGHITIEQLRSVSRTTSSGRSATTQGTVDVVGLKVGVVEVSVTDEGFVIGGLPPDAESFPGTEEPFPGQSPEEYVQAVLENLGARITLFRGAASREDGRGEHMELGMVLSVDNPAGGQGPIPPGRFDVILASSSSSSFASPPFVPLPDVAPDTPPTTEVQPSSSIGAGPETDAGTPVAVAGRLADRGADPGSGPAPPPAAQPVGFGDGVPLAADYTFSGVPMGLVIGILLLALLAARYVRNAFDAMFSSASGIFSKTRGVR